MAKGLFIAGTGTDVGKTYVTALMVKKLADAGLSAGYYKAAVSGAASVAQSDAGYVKGIAGIDQCDATLVSYRYPEAVSPHLAARWAGETIDRAVIARDCGQAAAACDYLTVEGSGGILCPLRWDDGERLLLADMVAALGLPVLLVADAGLGTINAVGLTAFYLKERQIPLRGIVLNRYTDTPMEADNRRMVEAMTGVPVVATVAPGDQAIDVPIRALKQLYAAMGDCLTM